MKTSFEILRRKWRDAASVLLVKLICLAGTFPLVAPTMLVRAAGVDSAIVVREQQVGGNAAQRYFLIQHKASVEATNSAGLILILPGGPGTKDFLPFCTNILTLYGVPTNFMVAELVAPQWSTNDDRVVWPGKAFGDPKARFSTEEFLAAVIEDVSRAHKIDERLVFTLGWSSSGHVLYSASMSEPRVRGSIIAMSRFLPAKMRNLDLARGKNYFLYHSPDDRICRFAEAQLAEQTLKDHGARVKLVTYPGGHGWVPNTYYCDRIKEGIEWLSEVNLQTNSPVESKIGETAGTNRIPASVGTGR